MPDSTAPPSTKFAYKQLPKFDPVHYRAWASDVRDAFAEREWNDYLSLPSAKSNASTSSESTPSTPPELKPHIIVQAKAFISQSIPYEHKYGLEGYTTAAEIFHALEQRYGSRSREDELRLESLLLDMRKLPSESIDQHIDRFTALMSSVIAQQSTSSVERYDKAKRNKYFLRTLELSKIPDENWIGFITYLGKGWSHMTPEMLFAETRSWYESHILPFKSQNMETSDHHVLAAFARDTRPPPNSSSFKSSSPKKFKQDKKYPNSNEKNSDLPRDSNIWCDYHRRTGAHSTDQCRAKLNDPEYLKHLEERNTTTGQANQSSSSTKPRNRMVRVRKVKSDSRPWLYDTACSENMTDQFEHLHDYTHFDQPISVYGAGDHPLQAMGSGTTLLRSSTSTSTHRLKKVWYVPELGDSIISKYWTRSNGLVTTLDEDENIILNASDPNSDFRIVSQSMGRLCVFPTLTAIPNAQPRVHVISSTVTTEDPPSDDDSPSESTSESMPESTPTTRPSAAKQSSDQGLLEHERFLHPSAERLALLGIQYTSGNCEPCILGKQPRTPFKPVEDKATKKLERVHMDHCGPVTPVTLGNGKYALNLRDEASNYTWNFIVSDRKAETIIEILKVWKPMVENQAGETLKTIRTDDAKEFKSVQEQYLQKFGVVHEVTAPYSSSSNGAVERVNRTLFDMVRPMLIRSKLPSPFWGEAISTAAKVLNRLPTKSNPNNMSPHEAWFGKKPCTSHLRQFGCIAYARIPTKAIGEGNKPAPRSIKCCMLGYIGNRMYRLWNPKRNKIIVSRDVVFKENTFPDASDFQNISQDFSPLQVLFNDHPDDPEEPLRDSPSSDDDDMPDLTPEGTSDDFVAPKHPARPQYRPSPPTTPATSTGNRYALLAPIPRPSIPGNDEPEYESDSDDDEDLYGTPVTPASTELNTPPRPPVPDTETGTDPVPSSPTIEEPPTTTGSDAQLIAPSQPTEPSSDAPTPVEPVQQSTSANSHPSRIRNPSEAGRRHQETEAYFAQKRSKAKPKARAKVTSTDSEPSYTIATQDTQSFEPPNEPKSLVEALASPDADKWYDAKIDEVDSHYDRETWTLVRRPTDQHVLDCKFIYKVKDPHTRIPRYKARLVAQGYTEIPGVDYTDTFAPVAKSTSVRSIFAICAAHRLHAHNFDVKTAYLYSTVQHDSYMEQPPLFEAPGFPRDEWVCKINKGIYGRHDSGHLWYDTVHKKFKDLHFIRSDADECVFILETPEHYIIAAVYVDDFLVAAKSLDDISWLHSELNKDWETRDLGPVKRFLGIDIHRPEPTGPIFLNQGTYARQMLHEFGLQDCNPVRIPMDPSVKLHKRRDDEPATNGELYRRITGKIMHMAIYTRPDLALASSKLSQFNSDPSETHMKAAKHILRYINGTLDYGILYSRPDSDLSFLPTGFCDASFDTDPDDSKSTTGWVYMFADGAISWGSNKQSCVALSTMESEYMAMSEAAKEAIFLQNLFESLNLSKRDQPISLRTDSQSAYDHVKNNVNHSRTKHIQRRHHFIRETYQNGDIDIERIPTDEQTADVLTKPLPRLKHEEAIKLLNMQSIRIPTNA